MTHLLACGKCKRVYYCSAECQRMAWKKGGHKEYCRKPGELKQGDYVRLIGIKSDPTVNGTLVQLVKPIENQEGRWETRIPGGTKSASISSEKMEQLRPLK